MKSTGLLGLMFLLLIVAYTKVEGTPREAQPRPDRSATLPAMVVMEDGGKLPARLSEYMFLHQTRFENIPVHAMADVTACSE